MRKFSFAMALFVCLIFTKPFVNADEVVLGEFTSGTSYEWLIFVRYTEYPSYFYLTKELDDIAWVLIGEFNDDGEYFKKGLTIESRGSFLNFEKTTFVIKDNDQTLYSGHLSYGEADYIDLGDENITIPLIDASLPAKITGEGYVNLYSPDLGKLKLYIKSAVAEWNKVGTFRLPATIIGYHCTFSGRIVADDSPDTMPHALPPSIDIIGQKEVYLTVGNLNDEGVAQEYVDNGAQIREIKPNLSYNSKFNWVTIVKNVGTNEEIARVDSKEELITLDAALLSTEGTYKFTYTIVEPSENWPCTDYAGETADVTTVDRTVYITDQPTVVAVNPKNNATNVCVPCSNSTITATFSKPMRPDVTDYFKILVDTTPQYDGGIDEYWGDNSGVVTYDAGTKQVRYTLLEGKSFDYNTKYIIQIMDGVESVESGPLAGSGDVKYEWSFTTPSQPVIVDVTPTDSSQVDDLKNLSISATFSSEMDTASLSTAFKVTDKDGNPIAGTVTNSTPTVAIFTPTDLLSYDATYSATITTDATDRAEGTGNPLTEEMTWTFSIGSAPPVVPGNQDPHVDPGPSEQPAPAGDGGGGGGGCFIGSIR